MQINGVVPQTAFTLEFTFIISIRGGLHTSGDLIHWQRAFLPLESAILNSCSDGRIPVIIPTYDAIKAGWITWDDIELTPGQRAVIAMESDI